MNKCVLFKRFSSIKEHISNNNELPSNKMVDGGLWLAMFVAFGSVRLSPKVRVNQKSKIREIIFPLTEMWYVYFE